MRLPLLLALLLLGSACSTRHTPTERDRIEHLLETVLASNITFIRNGRAHTASEAVDHLRSKWRQAGDRVKTAEQFIDQLATRSSTTGQPYRVRLVDGTEHDAGGWMHEMLARK